MSASASGLADERQTRDCPERIGIASRSGAPPQRVRWVKDQVMEVGEFSALFENFERPAFRVEARDRYDVEDEREQFAAFLEGKHLRPRTAESDPWLALIAAGRAAGRLIERVRIVSEPLTEYTRFEFAAYRDNIAAGEQIRVLPRATLADTDQGWASEDFWILDETVPEFKR